MSEIRGEQPEYEPYPPAEEKPEEENLALKEDRWGKKEKYRIEKTFERKENENDRVEYIINYLVKPSLESGPVYDKVVGDLQKECVSIEDRDLFVEKVFFILKPIYELRRDFPHPEQIPVNKALNYELKENVVELHFPSTGLKNFQLRTLYIEGLEKLAEIIKDDQNINNIFIDSWIIDKNPELVEKQGFKVKEGQGARIWSRSASISKEEFLNRYLKERK